MRPKKTSTFSEVVRDGKKFRTAFLDQIGNLSDVLKILEYIPDILFFMKDVQGRITFATRNFAVQMGGECEEDILGLDAFDLCPQKLAEQYTADDKWVMDTGRTLVSRLELNQGADGETGFFITHKSPLYNRSGEILGIVGITRNITESKLFLQPYDQFAEIIEHIRGNISGKLRVPDLAKMAHISASQFERRFRKVFGMSVAQYIVHIRVHEACRLLIGTGKTIGQIALEVGFYDQSALTRFFKRIIGMTPSAYQRGEK